MTAIITFIHKRFVFTKSVFVPFRPYTFLVVSSVVFLIMAPFYFTSLFTGTVASKIHAVIISLAGSAIMGWFAHLEKRDGR